MSISLGWGGAPKQPAGVPIPINLTDNVFYHVSLSREEALSLDSITFGANRLKLEFRFDAKNAKLTMQCMTVKEPKMITVYCHTDLSVHTLSLPANVTIGQLRQVLRDEIGMPADAKPEIAVFDTGSTAPKLLTGDDSQPAKLVKDGFICIHGVNCKQLQAVRERVKRARDSFVIEKALHKEKWLDFFHFNKAISFCVGLAYDHMGPRVAINVIRGSKYRKGISFPLLLHLRHQVGTSWLYRKPVRVNNAYPCYKASNWLDALELKDGLVDTSMTIGKCTFVWDGKACEKQAVYMTERCVDHTVPLIETRELARRLIANTVQRDFILHECELLTPQSKSVGAAAAGHAHATVVSNGPATQQLTVDPTATATAITSTTLPTSAISIGVSGVSITLQVPKLHLPHPFSRTPHAEQQQPSADGTAKPAADTDTENGEMSAAERAEQEQQIERQETKRRMSSPGATAPPAAASPASPADASASAADATAAAAAATPAGDAPAAAPAEEKRADEPPPPSLARPPSASASLAAPQPGLVRAPTSASAFKPRLWNVVDVFSRYSEVAVTELVVVIYTTLMSTTSKPNAGPALALAQTFDDIVGQNLDLITKFTKFFEALTTALPQFVEDGDAQPGAPIVSDGRTRLPVFRKTILAADVRQTAADFSYLMHPRSDVALYSNGVDYFDAVAQSMEKSEKAIMILAWELNPHIRLRESDTQSVGEFLKKKAEKVPVFIQIWEDPEWPQVTCGREAQKFFAGSAVKFKRAIVPPKAGFVSTHSHHQKMVLCDGGSQNWVGFVGGIDLTYGRRDDHTHSLSVRSPAERYNCECSTLGDDLAVWPEQPWHDVCARVHGPVLEDLWLNFDQRWKFTPQFAAAHPLPSEPDWTKVLPSTKTVLATRMVRSFYSRRRELFEQDIASAYCDAIGNAERFIYLVSQFFVDDGSHNILGQKANPVPNKVVEVILNRLARDANVDFVVYVVLPLYPEGDPASPTGAGAIMTLQWDTIVRCYDRIAKACTGEAGHRRPSDFLKFLTMGRCDSAFDSSASANSNASNKAKRLASTKRYMVYVHAKLMVVDDVALILGSANCNERSMAGDRDTELCLAMKPIDGQANPIAEFRQKLWDVYLAPSADEKKANDTAGAKAVAADWSHPSWKDTVERFEKRTQINWRRYRGCQDMNGLMPYPLVMDPTSFTCYPCDIPDCSPIDVSGKDTLLRHTVPTLWS